MPRKKSPSPDKKGSAASTPPKEGTESVCFVIMPFGGWFDDYYFKIYKPAIEEAGLVPHRADDLYRPSTITNDIWTYTQRANVVLADLSGKNPNVFYELGLAHSLAKPAIMVTQTMEDIPFDLRSLRIIVYDKNEPNWGDDLREKIVQSLKETCASPVESILPAFLSVKPSSRTAPISEHEKQFLELKHDVDLLRTAVLSRPPVTGIPLSPLTAPPPPPVPPPPPPVSRIESLSEARALVGLYRSRGLSDGDIRRRLHAWGLSPGTIERLLRQKNEESTAANDQSSAAKPE
jgi:hypothetical protein